jgi:hypothetical protein
MIAAETLSGGGVIGPAATRSTDRRHTPDMRVA